MMNACQIYTNDTLATSRKLAAKPASKMCVLSLRNL